VSNGKIAWIGHPMEMDKPLEKVTSGNYDISKAADDFRKEKAKQAKMMAIFQDMAKLGPAASPKDRIDLIDKAIKETPELEGILGGQKYVFMLMSGDKGASAYGTKLVDGALNEEAESLNQIAWMNLDPTGNLSEEKRDYKLAFKAAVRANELTKGENGAILDTAALAYFKTGKPAKALELQEKAIKVMGDGDQGMKDRLKQYRKAAEDEKKP
jgi:tetratricopeptide (TPR) repeat protein